MLGSWVMVRKVGEARRRCLSMAKWACWWGGVLGRGLAWGMGRSLLGCVLDPISVELLVVLSWWVAPGRNGLVDTHVVVFDVVC